MQQTEMVKVWDPLVRLFHWTLAGGFVVAYLSAEVSSQLSLHTLAGYTVLGLLAFRLVWGLVGPRHARFSDFVRSPAAIAGYLKSIVSGHPRRYLGHNPAGGAMVVALLVALLLTTCSGIVLLGGEEFSGPLAGWMATADEEFVEVVEELHELAAHLTLLLVVLHLIGVTAASLQHRENLPRSMVTGYKRSEPSE